MQNTEIYDIHPMPMQTNFQDSFLQEAIGLSKVYGVIHLESKEGNCSLTARSWNRFGFCWLKPHVRYFSHMWQASNFRL